MRATPWSLAEPYRQSFGGYLSNYGDDYGVFQIPHAKTGVSLRVIASSGAAAKAEGMDPWDHVSVSLPNRCPNWIEMEFIKRLFFDESEVAFQLHVPVSEHISFHPHCLHIWRPLHVQIPVPPAIMVGPQS